MNSNDLSASQKLAEQAAGALLDKAPDGDAGDARLEVLTSLAGSRIAPWVTVALTVFFLIVNEGGYQSVSAITRVRDETVATRIVVGRLRTAVLAAESAQRSLLLTERPIYRQNLVDALAGLGAMIETARKAAEDNPTDAKAVQEIVDVAGRKLSEMQETVIQVDQGRRAAALELVLADIGREQMAEVNRLANDLIRRQEADAAQGAAQRDQVLMYSRYTIMALVLACLAAVLTAMRLIRNREAERLGYVAGLRAERDKLQDRVAEHTQSLTKLASHLQTVREDERSHLSRELHDELGGLLTAAKLDLARLRSRLMQAGPEVAERVEHLKATLDAVIALKRRIIEDLRPSSLDNLGLRAALEILCTEWSARNELKIKLDLQELSLSPERALAAYRLVQEALTNITKYAQARQVFVAMRAEAGAAQLTVRDDGKGFTADQHTAGHGLAGMRFRIATCGGSLTVESAPGQGSTIRARLPLS